MSNELLLIFVYLIGLAQGAAVAYIISGRDTAFKRGFVDGLSLKFIWGRFVK